MDFSLKTCANVSNQSRPLPRPPSAAPPFDPIAIEHSPQKQSPSPPPPSPLPPQLQVVTPPGSPPTYSALVAPSSPKPYAKPKQNSHTSFMMSNLGHKMSAAQQLYANSLVNHGMSLPTLPPPSFESNAPKTVPDRGSFYQNNVSSYISSSSPVQLPVSSASSISSGHSLQTSFSQTYDASPMPPSSPPYSEHYSSDGVDHQHFDGVNLNNISLPRGYTGPDVPHLTPTSQLKQNTGFNSHSTQPTRTLFDLKYVNAGRNKPKAIRNVVTSMISPRDPGGAHVDKNTPSALLPSRGRTTPEQRKHSSSIASSMSSLTSSVSQVLLPSPPPPCPNIQSRPQQQQEPRSSVYYQTVEAELDRNDDNTDEQFQLNHDWDNRFLPDEGSQKPTQTAILPRGAGQPCLVHRPSQAPSHQAHPPAYDPYDYH